MRHIGTSCRPTRRALFVPLGAVLLAGCSSDDWLSPPSVASPVTCSTPGSVVFDDTGRHVVPGRDAAELGWLTLPAGFCAHHFANVPKARQIRFAPGGELFVASPATPTADGGREGLGAIAVVPDDDHDGLGDTTLRYLDGMASTQGLLFASGWFYYQDGTQIVRRSYRAGDRKPSGVAEVVADIQAYVSISHWPKAFDAADDGTIYVGNGGDQIEQCEESRPFHGGILVADGTPGGRPVVRGLRNPIAIRCRRGKNRCFAAELGRDQSDFAGGREKLITIHEGDDWGYPCCTAEGRPFPDVTPPPDCGAVMAESNSFAIGDTPFGFDFAPSGWPAPWGGAVILTLHGEIGTWTGARIVAIAADPVTGMPLASSTIGGASMGAITAFATGWDDATNTHGRPADVTIAPDGRLFVADDTAGEIFWVAPL